MLRKVFWAFMTAMGFCLSLAFVIAAYINGVMSRELSVLLGFITVSIYLLSLMQLDKAEEKRRKRYVIFFDMDGVLNYFEKVTPAATRQKGFFLTRLPDKVTIDTVKFLYRMGYDVRILSSVYQNGYAEDEKKTWLYAVGLGEIPAHFVPYGEDKAKYVRHIKGKDAYVLIDDYSQNLFRWEDYGSHYVGIKYLNGLNGTKGSWTGNNGKTVSFELPPKKLAAHIVDYTEKRNRLRMSA